MPDEELADGDDPMVTPLQAALDHAELSLRGGSPREAEQQLEAIWLDVVTRGLPELEGRARLARALTLNALGRLDDAIIELEYLLASSARDGAQSIRAATSLSHLYLERGDPTRAIEIGERQLEIVRRHHVDPSDDAIRLAVTVAAAYFERGDVAHAARMCRRAIAQAEELDSPVAKASAYWNASLMESQRGAVEAAVPLAAKALRLMESAQEDRGLAQLRTALGSLQLRLDPPQIDEARANLEAAEKQLLWTSASPIDLGRNALALARADLLSGDIRGAENRAISVLEQARGSAALVSVEALMLLGEAGASRGDAEGAGRHCRAAVLELTSMGSDRAAAEVWFELGAMLEGLGLEGEAHDAYRSAAASTGLRTMHGNSAGNSWTDS